MMSSLSRRRLLAAAVPGLLAGCLVESDETADAGANQGSDADAGGSGPGSEDSVGSDRDANDGGANDGDANDGDAGADDSTAEQTDGEPVPEEVGPDGAGLVVTNVDVRGVTDDGYETTVDARLTVENRGRFTYGTVELRVDAYATRPGSSERDSVGFAYDTERFTSGNRFDGGTRGFDVSITFRSRETNAPADPDWYEVDAAVRRAEPA